MQFQQKTNYHLYHIFSPTRCVVFREIKREFFPKLKDFYTTPPIRRHLILPYQNLRNSLVSQVNIYSQCYTNMDFTATKKICFQVPESKSLLPPHVLNNPHWHLPHQSLGEAFSLPHRNPQGLIFKTFPDSLTTSLKLVLSVKTFALSVDSCEIHMMFSVKHQITQGIQPPNSPELVPCNFWLFPN